VQGSDSAVRVVDVALELDDEVMSNPAATEEGVDGVDLEACVDLPRRKRTDSTANLSTSETSDEPLDDLSAFEGDRTMIAIPIAGECRHDLLPASVGRTLRQVPNGCAICLSCFEVDDKLSWSSNPECSHVFHHSYVPVSLIGFYECRSKTNSRSLRCSCILDWLQTSGKKALRRRRRNQDASIVSYAFDPVSRITKFPTYCPCCRQEFILQSADEESNTEKPADSSPSGQVATAESESLPTTFPSVGDRATIHVPA
jgi:hypothetical protein